MLEAIFPALLPVAIILVLLVLGAVVASVQKRTKRDAGFPYAKRPALFTPAERSFLGVLDHAVGSDYRIFGKVRVADILQTKKGLERGPRQAAFNRISAKHFDFVLCEQSDMSVVCAIELDDKSHHRRARENRDAFLIQACEAAELPLVRISARRAYVAQDIAREIAEVRGAPFLL